MSPQVFSFYRVNPEEFIMCAGGLILSEKGAMVVEHVEHHETDRSYDTAIFTSRMPDNANKAYEARKNAQRFVFPDSQGERRFARTWTRPARSWSMPSSHALSRYPRRWAATLPTGR